MKSIYERLLKRALLSTLIIHFSLLSFAATYYVSNAGSDLNSGLTTTLPWKTLAKVSSFVFKAGDQILFERGSSFYGTLTIISSGASGSPITYGTYGAGANPVITGFTTVTGWTNEGGGIYSKVITSESQTNMVTIDGVQYGMGRYPNSTYLTYESYSTDVSITDNQLTGSPNWTGAELIKRPNDWELERSLITNHTNGTLTYTNSLSNYTGVAGNGYFIQNDIRTLDQFGEWYHNYSGTGKFYMYFGAVDPTTKIVKVATKNYIINNTGATNITLDGLTLNGSIESVIETSRLSNYFTVKNCTITFAGSNGIRINSQYGLVENNMISECNSSAVRGGGSNNVTVINNTVTNIGLIRGMSKGYYNAIMLSASNNHVIQFNSIQNAGSDGIMVNGTGVTIANNFINYTNLILNDGGGIYTAGTNTGTIIDGNIVLNAIGNTEGGNTPISISEGIYLDEFANGIAVQNNTVANCGFSGIKLHKAHDNTITNNTCFGNRITGIYILNSSTATSIVNNIITNNKFIAKSGQYSFYIKDVKNAVPQFGTSNNNYFTRPINETNVFSYYPTIGFSTKSLTEWKLLTGQDVNSIKSPQSISSENDLLFEYNVGNTTKSISLSQPMIDVKGTKYVGTVTLQPYTSVVLMKDANPDLGDVIAPVVTGFSIPATSTSLTVSVSGLTASDNVGVTGYLLTETSTKPTSTATGWSLTKPTSYTFSSIGTKSLYVWAKDAVGNVSVSLSDQVIITLPSTSNTLGNTEVYSGTSTAANRRAMPITFSEAGSIQSLSIYHNGGTGYVLMGVYSDQTGVPSSQLGVTSSTVINTTAGWQTVPLTSPVTVTAGQTVWLAWVFQNNPGVRYISGTPGRAQSTATWTGGMPATFGTSAIDGNKFSIYCTYTINDAEITTNTLAATAFTLTGPLLGNVNSASANFTVTPNNPYTGTITVTPSGSGSAGLSAKVLTFTNSPVAQLFTITPTVAGSITLTATNNGSLVNPSNLNYTVNAVAPDAPVSVSAIAGNTTATVTFVAPVNNGGTSNLTYAVTSVPAGGTDINAGTASLTHTISGLTNGTSYTFTVKATNSAGTSVSSTSSNSVTPVAVTTTEYKSICDGSSYNGWTVTGKYERTLILESGGENIVTTYLTVNPKYSVSEDITINSGENYNGWTATGEYTRTLSSISGCDSIVTTNLTVVVNSEKQGQITSHFVPVWQGQTGTNLMNFVINSAVFEDMPLSANDEIGVFSGSTCVGAGKLVNTINPADQSTYLSFQASQNTGTNNGYILNDTIVFKIWDNTNQLERSVQLVSYQPGTAPVITTGKFSSLATVIVGIESFIEYTQTISLKQGNNMFSTYIVPTNPDLGKVVKPLSDQGKLYKIQDEAGLSFEYWGSYGGWINKIGNVERTEGYNINVTSDCTLNIVGRMVSLPLNIPLKRGWNFISFPQTQSVDAMTVLQSLISTNKLDKVQDEAGNSIEKLKKVGWVNNIGNFISGKGYKVYVNSNTSLTIEDTYPKSATILAGAYTTEYFYPHYEGNGISHMNINMIGLSESGLSEGDELAAYDGETCVGALKITGEHLLAGNASLVSSYSTNEQIKDGFTNGNQIILYAWNKNTGEETEVHAELLDGTLTFAQNASTLINLNNLTTGTNHLSDEVTIDVYPNPSKGNFTVRLNELPEIGSKIEILDNTGRSITSRQITNQFEAFYLDNPVSGLYFIKTTFGTKSKIDKLIVNK